MKLLIINTHPVNYHVPIYKKLADSTEFDVEVCFLWDVFSARYRPSQSFPMHYDKSLLNGYKHSFLKNISLKPGPTFWGLINFGLFSKIKNSQCDAVLIFGYNYFSAWIALISAKILGKKIIFKGESDLLAKRSFFKEIIKKVYVKTFFNRVDYFLYSYKKNAEYYCHYGASRRSLYFMPCAVDNEYFQAIAANLDRQEERGRLGFAEDEVVMLYVGRLEPRKQPDLLLRALSHFCKTKIRLVYVGDGSMMAALKDQVKALSLENQVRFDGFKSHELINAYFKSSDLLVLPSLLDPSPKVVNEAMNFSLPVIVSDKVGTANDLVVNRQNGMVFKAGDVNSLVLAMKEVAFDQAVRARLSEKALSTVSQWNYQLGVESVKSIMREVSHA
ncbi:MAG: hypothetical protein CMF39_05735 [Legionellaceae bacterium]|nr:hypothetical protein [Legionellaceae bacterium]|tara:strand:- start:1839 stop:3002 length:1164 start_codon:yes stop_codon:yes gene_type:complete